MRLKDCLLDIDAAVFNQETTIGQLDQKWVDAQEKAIIPPSLFRLYSLTNYFGFEKSPKYLKDSRKLLFPYLEGMTRGMRDSLIEGNKFIQGMPVLDRNSYTPKKEANREFFDPEAADEIVRSFKYALLNLSGALDQFSEIAGMILFPDLDNVQPGRASFKQIMKLVEGPAKASNSILTPREHYSELLKSQLAPLVNSIAPKKDWLKLLFLYRNKLAHLGTSAFQLTCFHDANGDFYSFLPKRWPDFFKQHMQRASSKNKTERVSMKAHAEKDLTHCDLLEYSQNLQREILKLLEVGLGVICEAYKHLKDCDPNEAAATQIFKNSESYEFEYFND